MYTLKEGQLERLLKIIKNNKQRLIILLMQNGLRLLVTISLKISSFDFRKRTVILKKEKSIIKIPLSRKTYQVLSRHIAGLKEVRFDSYLFPGKKGRSHIDRKSVNKFLERIARVHIEFEGMHPKSFYKIVGLDSNISWFVRVKNSLENYFGGNEMIQIHNLKTELPTVIKTFGRKKEIEKLLLFVVKKVNVMILGGVGVGKTHLIKGVLKRYMGKVIMLDDIYEIKKSLINILLFLYKGNKNQLEQKLYPGYDFDKLNIHLQKHSISNLCRQIKSLIEAGEYLLVIDSCDNITPRTVKVLEELKDHFVFLTSAREIPLNKSSFSWNFEIIKLKNLKRSYSLGLITDLSAGMQIEDFGLYRNHIFEQSVGNPRVIQELVSRYKKEVIVSSEIVREVRHTGSLKQYDCSWLVIIFLGFISVLRFMSHELGNDSLRFIGGCAVLSLLIFRNFISKRRKL